MRSSTLVALAASFALSLSQNILLPVPSGPYGVDTSVLALTDDTRLDPYAPTKQYRRILLTAYYPSGDINKCSAYPAPYMPPATAQAYDQDFAAVGVPNGTFEAFQLPLCKFNHSAAWQHPAAWPVVLFSPGLGSSRLIHGAMAEALSSQGYIVITMDHPYDAAIVEFPDGSVVYGLNFTTLAAIGDDVAVRRADVQFLVRKLNDWNDNHRNPFNIPCGKLDLKSLYMFGHSLGGATTGAAMYHIPSIRGGVDLDGTLFGPVVTSGLDRPFMLFGHDGMNRTTDDTWASIWPHLSGARIELELLNSLHLTFTDLPLLAEVLGLADAPGVSLYLGSVEGKRVLVIITAYLDAFFRFVNGEAPLPRLSHNVTKFPEVVVVESRLGPAH